MGTVIEKEELREEMERINNRLAQAGMKLDEASEELVSIFNDFGELIRPIVEAFYDSSEETKNED